MPERIRIGDLFRRAWLALTNPMRLLRMRRMDYVILEVSGSYPEWTQTPLRRFPLSLLPWPPAPPSVQSFGLALEQLAGDPRVRGAVFIVSNLSAEPATLSSLRQAVTRFRQSGKRAVAYLHHVDTWSYYLACACDEILVPESASVYVAGLRSETVFLKETLAMVGVQADFEAIAEYKVSPDTFRRAEMTEPHREMLESLLDSLYTEIVRAIASGRDTSPEHAAELMDSAPLTTEEAYTAGLLDAICYEDELPARLGTAQEPATLIGWEQARKHLIRSHRWHSRRAIGLISLEGTIVTGPSRQPPIPLPLPLPAAQAGSDTLIQQIRSAGQDKHLAAAVLHVDSPGGSVLASDLIWREVAHLRRIKPVIVYMSNMAASGGYYVSAPANTILAQPTTLTGSIGIWGGKIVTGELFAKVRAGREAVSRGKAAGLYTDAAPFSDEERRKIRASIGAGYARFKARVAEGRGMADQEVEAIACGRVWTGEQALGHGLVDELGDLQTAADRARDLAGIDPNREAPLVPVSAPKRQRLSPPTATDAGEWLAGFAGFFQEGLYALAPWKIRVRG